MGLLLLLIASCGPCKASEPAPGDQCVLVWVARGVEGLCKMLGYGSGYEPAEKISDHEPPGST